MTAEHLFQTSEEVEAALASRELQPPPPPSTLGSGATATLRSAMARFDAGPSHQERRDRVVERIERLDAATVAAIARRNTEAVFQAAETNELDARRDIAFVVPTLSVAEALNLSIDESLPNDVRDDVREVVHAIGRGEQATDRTDEATTRLLEHLQVQAGDPVAAASMLYQNYDATAALITSHLVAHHQATERRSALAKTVRVATADTEVGGRSLLAGDMVTLDLESSGFEFGSGPHQCPGRELAESIATAVVETIIGSGYEVVADGVVYAADGRATALPIHLSETTETNRTQE